jgi:hypothetical protein
LPAARIDRITELCGGDLLGVRFLDAPSHPRIQLADMLAGTVRKLATSEPELVRRYIDESSIRPSRAAGTTAAAG